MNSLCVFLSIDEELVEFFPWMGIYQQLFILLRSWLAPLFIISILHFGRNPILDLGPFYQATLPNLSEPKHFNKTKPEMIKRM